MTARSTLASVPQALSRTCSAGNVNLIRSRHGLTSYHDPYSCPWNFSEPETRHSLTRIEMSMSDSNDGSQEPARSNDIQRMAPGIDRIIVRPNRRKSSRACRCCRDRKVRCDVVIRGHPCTNCVLDGRECYVPEIDRRR